MQQVSARTFSRNAASASIVVQPPRPVLRQRRRSPRALANVNRLWVLHKPLLVRAMAALVCAALIAGAFQARGGIMQAATGLSNILQGEFAAAGLGVSEISITGQVLTGEARILETLGLDEDKSILGFDAAAARQRLLELPAISEATVRKIYPDRIIVSLTEKHPVARWTVNDATYLVDAAGDRIGMAQPADKKLPLVIGDGAADDALVIIRAMGRYPAIGEGLVAYSRLADRRWDLIYDTGLRVRLPETGIAQALERLNAYQTDYRILDREIGMVDLRVDGLLVVRPTIAENEDQAGQD